MDATDSDVAYVRRLIGDAYDDGVRIFSDTEITDTIGRNRTLKRAAADLLEQTAVSQVLISRKITTQDLSTDGPALSAELRALADRYRAESDADEEGDSDGLYVAVLQPDYVWAAELTEYPIGGFLP